MFCKRTLAFVCSACKCGLVQCDSDGIDWCYAVDVFLPSNQDASLGKFALFKCVSTACAESATYTSRPNKNRKILCKCSKCLRVSASKGIVRSFDKRERDFKAGHYQYGGDRVETVESVDTQIVVSTSRKRYISADS